MTPKLFLTFLQFLTAGSVVFMVGWTLWSSIREMIAVAKRMHEIPCTTCRYFSNDYRLKCSIHPMIANTEDAIDCSDYRSS